MRSSRAKRPSAGVEGRPGGDDVVDQQAPREAPRPQPGSTAGGPVGRRESCRVGDGGPRDGGPATRPRRSPRRGLERAPRRDRTRASAIAAVKPAPARPSPLSIASGERAAISAAPSSATTRRRENFRAPTNRRPAPLYGSGAKPPSIPSAVRWDAGGPLDLGPACFAERRPPSLPDQGRPATNAPRRGRQSDRPGQQREGHAEEPPR